jgi:hypothetical protein
MVNLHTTTHELHHLGRTMQLPSSLTESTSSSGAKSWRTSAMCQSLLEVLLAERLEQEEAKQVPTPSPRSELALSATKGAGSEGRGSEVGLVRLSQKSRRARRPRKCADWCWAPFLKPPGLEKCPRTEGRCPWLPAECPFDKQQISCCRRRAKSQSFALRQPAAAILACRGGSRTALVCHKRSVVLVSFF